ncbi:GNAT family N-acetyltransferase [Streptococcus danieliae]|uniref:GNAT family N-acetyltransferase n=1 Tax=Streptococcus danieliae TaxID=747656 RepID=UPI0026E9F897|nr:GNAT family protein [Streptococcus danieliae]
MIKFEEKLGFLEVPLNVQERNQAARALYEKMGFSYEGRQEKAIQLWDGRYETVLLMGLVLDRE